MVNILADEGNYECSSNYNARFGYHPFEDHDQHKSGRSRNSTSIDRIPPKNRISNYQDDRKLDPDREAILSIVEEFLFPHIDGPLRVLPPTRIVSHTGTTQYRFHGAGTTSCGLTASNFARLVFKKYTSGTKNEHLLEWLLTKDCTMEITAISEHYTKSVLLEVAEIIGSPPYLREIGDHTLNEPEKKGFPYFTEALDAYVPEDGLSCTYESFLRILQSMDDIIGISATIITKPPEIVAAMKIPMQDAYDGKVFVVFDSHGWDRLYPNGSAIVLCPTMKDAAKFLATRYPAPTDINDCHLSSSQIGASRVRPSRRARERINDQKLLEWSMRMLELEAEARSNAQISGLYAKLNLCEGPVPQIRHSHQIPSSNNSAPGHIMESSSDGGSTTQKYHVMKSEQRIRHFFRVARKRIGDLTGNAIKVLLNALPTRKTMFKLKSR